MKDKKTVEMDAGQELITLPSRGTVELRLGPDHSYTFGAGWALRWELERAPEEREGWHFTVCASSRAYQRVLVFACPTRAQAERAAERLREACDYRNAFADGGRQP